MKFSRLLLSFAVIALVTLSGCVRAPKYTPRPLTKLTKETADYSQTKDNVTVMAKKLTGAESAETFGTDLTTLKEGITPVQLTVENNNPINMQINSKDVNLRLLSEKNITEKLSHSVGARVAGYGALMGSSAGLAVGGFFATVEGVVSLAYIGVGMPLLATGSVLLFGGAALFVAAPIIGIINAVKTAKVNKLIKADVEEKTLSTLTIQPNETKNTLIFVHTKDLPNEFNLKVAHEADANRTIDFAISLHPKIQSDVLIYKG